MSARPRWTLVALLLAALLIGCGGGGEEEPDDSLVRALGGDAADVEQFDAVVDAIGPFADAQPAFVAAMRGGDIRGAIDAAEAMEAQIDEGLRQTRELHSAKLRVTFEEYLRAAEDYAGAAGAIVSSLQESGGPPSAQETQRLIARLTRAQQALRSADETLVRRIEKELPEDERDEFQDTLGDVDERQREIIGGD